MQCNFILINSINIHYRKIGNGPLFFLLHPSPRNSKMMEPLMQLLADSFTVIAMDTPGYGFSDKLNTVVNTVYEYVPIFNQFVKSFTNEPIKLYGTATGAQIAIAYGLTYPQNIKNLYLDNTAHFEEEECDEILKHYFININADAEGNHLKLLWSHICDSCMYFPWYKKNEFTKISNQLPPLAVVQNIVTDYLLAGTNYADAYRVAFKHERAKHVQQLKCNTIIFKWLASPIIKHIEKLLSFKFEENISIVETNNDVTERYEKMKLTFLQ
jgi:pimeloyl-ACP methyl ester carboxylesterase